MTSSVHRTQSIRVLFSSPVISHNLQVTNSIEMLKNNVSFFNIIIVRFRSNICPICQQTSECPMQWTMLAAVHATEERLMASWYYDTNFCQRSICTCTVFIMVQRFWVSLWQAYIFTVTIIASWLLSSKHLLNKSLIQICINTWLIRTKMLSTLVYASLYHISALCTLCWNSSQ